MWVCAKEGRGLPSEHSLALAVLAGLYLARMVQDGGELKEEAIQVKLSTLSLAAWGTGRTMESSQEWTPAEGDTASIPIVHPSRASLPVGAQQEMELVLGDSSEGPKAEAEKLVPGCQVTTEQPCGPVHQDRSPQQQDPCLGC